jgi:hypothetical protein
MALDGEELGEILYEALASAMGNPPTDFVKALGKGVVAAVKAAQYANPVVVGGGVPVNAPSPNAGTFTGSSQAGKFLVVTPSLISAPAIALASSPLIIPQITAQAGAIATHLMSMGLINFSFVEGNCTALGPFPAPFPGAPGVLVAGRAKGGKLSGISGAVLGPAAIAAMGGVIGPDTIPFYTAMCDYLMEKAEFEYLPNSINGAFSIGGGPLIGGVGMGGIVK